MLSFLIFSVIFTLLSFLLSTRIVQEFLRSKVFEFFGYTALISFIIIALLATRHPINQVDLATVYIVAFIYPIVKLVTLLH
jgi:quinol-cytochrome oxidoreductase complex cytochrome b subunit